MTQPIPPKTSGISSAVIIAATIILVVAMVVVGLLLTTHNDPTTLITLIAGTIIPTFVTLFVLGKVDSTQQQVMQVQQKAQEIGDNVDGNLTALISKVQQNGPNNPDTSNDTKVVAQ